MKILLLGANGQVGWELRRSLALLGEVVALERNSSPLCGDLAQPAALAETVRSVAPQVIVNAAAYTAVDKAQTETAQAHAINAAAPEVLAREAERLGAWLVHYSTDYVFDGGGTRPWTEDDATGPISAYGSSKLEGEQAVVRECARHVVLRTSWVYETWGANFLKTILRAAAQRDALKVVDDQWGAPTRAALIADVTACVLRRLQPAQAGIYHLAAAGETNWHAYASFALQEAMAAGAKFKTSLDRIQRVPTSEYPTPTARPANSRLDTGKLRRTFELTLPPWQHGVSAVVRELAACGAIGIPDPKT